MIKKNHFAKGLLNQKWKLTQALDVMEDKAHNPLIFIDQLSFN
jgi:hypothetical protein